MKFIILASMLLIAGFSFSQTVYESPYVVNGQSVKMTIPASFHFIDSPDMGISIYSLDPNINMDSEDISADCIMFYVMPNEENITMEEAMTEAFGLSEEEAKNIRTVKTSDGSTFILGSANLEEVMEETEFVEFGLTLFEDVMIGVMYINVPDKFDNPKIVENIAKSYRVYETNRENEFVFFDYDSGDYEEVTGFNNSLFDTRLTYTEVFLEEWQDGEEETNWHEDFEQDYNELLLAYQYIDFSQDNPLPQGGIKFFSGGMADNFKRLEDQLEALQRVFPEYHISEIKFEKEVEGYEFNFKRYHITSLSKSNNALKFYSTNYQGELLFFMVYEEWQPTDEFAADYESMIKTFFIIED